MSAAVGRFTVFCALLASAVVGGDTRACAQATLEATLSQRPLAALAKRARILGDPARGAILFHRLGLSCTQCHTIGAAGP